MKSRVQKPEKKWMLANHRSSHGQFTWKTSNVRIHNQRPRPFVSQPVPTVRVGGSSGSGTRSGVGSRTSEANTDDLETKRVRFTQSRGQKRQGEDVEELAAKAEEQHLDADVEVRAHKTWRVENVVGDAADAAPETNEHLALRRRTVHEQPYIEQDGGVREN